MTNCIRTNFTKHGMHLYNIGELETPKQIVKCIRIVTNKVARTPTRLG
jgi:hypothetical protein